MGCGIEPRKIDIAGAESLYSLEGKMCGTAMRGADALPGSKATSRAKGSYRNLGGLGSGRRMLRERGGPHREGEEPKPMMHGPEKSDPAIVVEKPANKANEPTAEASAEANAAEPVERRVGTKGNADQQSTCRTQSRVSVEQALERIRKVAKERKKERFTALLHHVSIDLLEEAFYELNKDAASGVDRLTWDGYEADLERMLEDLHERVHRGAYRALPSRRVYIPKPDGRQRPLAVAALEDKIVQRAVATVLNAIYEEDFLGFSYGFRPGRGAHHALDALCVAIHSKTQL
jgi:RNA-directed DNA polymerase